MPKSRNRSRDIRKRAAKKRKNKVYQEKKRKELANTLADTIPEKMSPNEYTIKEDEE